MIRYDRKDTPQQARENGRKSYAYGIPYRFAPHTYGKAKQREWMLGWREAQRAAHDAAREASPA